MKATRMGIPTTTRKASSSFAASLHRLATAAVTFVAVITATAIEDLDEALLNDIVESYSSHVPTECNTQAQSSSFSFDYDWPGTNPQSGWNVDYVARNYEEGLFQAIMSHTDANNANRSWTIRIGTGGNMYSVLFPNSLGEIIPPQNHPDAPWIDEVQQMVAVAGALSSNPNNAQQCPGGYAQRDNDLLCKKYFIHNAGSYQRDAPYTNSPFYSTSLARHCHGNTCTFMSWGSHAHVVTPFTSPALYINRYTNCNNGIIEHTQMIHNFANPSDPLAIPENDLNHFNVAWGGVRPSKLPFVLEPSNIDTLDYENVNSIDPLPLCLWSGNDDRGRAAPRNLPDTGGYTTFVENGLLVNRTLSPLLPPCRRPNVTCGTTTDPTLSCMVDTCTEAQIATGGYVRMALKVAPNSTPNCLSDGVIMNGLVSLQCDFHDVGFGRHAALLTSYDKCSPWTDIGLFNGRTRQGMNIFQLKQWSISPTTKRMSFVVYATDKVAAQNTVNSMFNNTDRATDLVIELRALRKNRDSFSSPRATIQSPTMSIPFQTLPAEYNPSALNAFTYVYGRGEDYALNGIQGLGRRRMGSTAETGGRDYTVFSVNWQSGARLEPSSTYTNRGYYFVSDLGSVKATADSLRNKVAIDKIELEQWSPRKVEIYKRGTNFVVRAAPSSGGLYTTCASSSASLACSGWSTPKAGHVPYFYVKCQNSTYLGPNPYRFTPSFGSRFPGHGSAADQRFVRSYVCDGMIWSGRERILNADAEDALDDFRAEDVAESAGGFETGTDPPFVRPTWKLMGFFPIDGASCASLETDTYEETVCDPVPTSSPSSSPTTSNPTTSKPTSCGIANDGRMPAPCPCGGLGCWGEDATGQCCSKFCRITNLGSSFCKASPTPAPTPPPTTSKPTSCGIANDGRMPGACPCGGPGCWGEDTTGQCCSKFCRITYLGSSFCKGSPTPAPTSRPTSPIF